MKFFRLDLLTLLISLFILNSCKNQGTVGLGSTTGPISGALVDTATIITNTVLEDSVVTSQIAKNPLGYFKDPIFGTTESSLASDINLPNGFSYTLPTGTISVDSTRLVLRYADGFYGDSLTSAYTVNVYQLAEKYTSSTVYYNTKQWKYNSSVLLGTKTFAPRPHDSIKIYNIVAGSPDTLIKVPPQVRIPINNSFITNNLFAAPGTVLTSNANFQNAVKGLYLTVDKTSSTGQGGIMMINQADSIAVYYRVNNGTSIDTTVLKLPITTFAAQIKHTYSSTVSTELSNTTSSRGVVYLQGLAGLRAKISFPNLLANLRSNLLKKDSDLVLNRAELVITPSPGSTTPYRALPKLTMYQLDLAHQRTFIQDGSTTDRRSGGIAVFGGFYNKTQNEYHFIVTAYIQDLLYNKRVDYGTFIAPVDTTNKTSVDIGATPQVAARTLAIGGDKTSQYRMKLNIIYTRIAK